MIVVEIIFTLFTQNGAQNSSKRNALMQTEMAARIFTRIYSYFMYGLTERDRE